jgi:glycosyltransferase involved in cell wall biosynthesis
MRIAVIAARLLPDTGGGAEAYVDLVVPALAAHHHLVVYTGSAAQLAGVETIRIPALPQLERDQSPHRKVLWHTRDQWLPSVHRALSSHLERLRPDVVLTQQPQGLSAAVFTAPARRRLPTVYIAHDYNLMCARVTLTRNGRYCGGGCIGCLPQRLLRGTLAGRAVTYLVAVSEYVRDRHVEAGVVPADRAIFIRLGAASGNARVRRYESRRLTVGFVGALSPHKGVRTLLRAFEHSPNEWRLIVAGTGPLADEVSRAAADDGRIELRGYVVGAQKEELFDEIDVVAIPSEWEEPATFVAVEAALRGIPAVVSGRGGLTSFPEARRFTSGNPKELLAALEWFTKGSALADASARLLEQADEFRLDTHVQRLEAVLERAVADVR